MAKYKTMRSPMDAVNRFRTHNNNNNNNSGWNSIRMMVKRFLFICFFLAFGIWLIAVHQPDTEEAYAVSSVIPATQMQVQMQMQQQSQPSANGSKPNQIHDPSRTQQLISNLSSYYYYSPSLVSLDNAATPAPMPTAASRSPSASLSASASASSPSSPPAPATQLSSDASQLIDLHHFAYLMAQPACESHIQALILVHTAPWNAEKRSLIRETWGGSSMTSAPMPLRVVFLLGAVSQADQQLQLALELENARHADMVQGNFQDAYRNMTYKHVMAFKWFNSSCSHAQLLIKVDDDVYVNTPLLIQLLSTTNRTSSSSLRGLLQQPHDLLFCRPELRSRVKRSYRSKWRVSFREFADDYYPPYCPGFAIVYSPDVVQRLYQAAQHAGYFWVDDVHITGVLAQQTNTTITTLKPYVLYESACERLLSGRSDPNQLQFLFTGHSISPEQIRRLWQLHVSQNGTQRNEESAQETGLS
ncbi:beta-1,3-galactosyltransferase brn [Drosophila virilis]|uniref:Hexosyltransferase n=1 Tax=Drosophila virilis TaxID=7244 RepID=B4MFY4_DROVI|nr:beta-1,3-galactosyltransferase brn [Drosophila virilis]EDW58245.1 uncharacterized protein Dvir_GJ15510, isoform A [Drosophila virilis]KRF78189.1 uncharacterized protein Dvir_GJ15510, isoform B [Drosophila virilis]KRF78190.1 uncharacterized protein Dvir_GJ15510, isoform C [Drosophila virilis]